MSTFDGSRSPSSPSCRSALPVCRHRAPCQPSSEIGTSRFDGSTVLVIKTDVTYTVTHQTTQILPPAGPPKRSRRERQEAVRTASRWSRARGIDDGVPAMGPDEGPGSKTRAEAAVWGHGEPRARKTALGREELLYKNPAWVEGLPVSLILCLLWC